MKNFKSIILISILSVGCFACQEPVKFREPQPSGKNNLSHFPCYMKGIFKSTVDDYTLEITNKLILRRMISEVSISKAEADTSDVLTLNGNLLIDSSNEISIKVKLINDTLRGTVYHSDTIFIIDHDNVLRKFRGHYFMNTKLPDQGYTVRMLTYERGGKLTLSEIEKDEIENLKSVTEITEPIDSNINSYQFQPTKKEFKKFVNDLHGFRNKEYFIKVR